MIYKLLAIKCWNWTYIWMVISFSQRSSQCSVFEHPQAYASFQKLSRVHHKAVTQMLIQHQLLSTLEELTKEYGLSVNVAYRTDYLIRMSQQWFIVGWKEMEPMQLTSAAFVEGLSPTHIISIYQQSGHSSV